MSSGHSHEELADRAAALGAEHGVALDLPGIQRSPPRPSNVTHLSSPAYESPLRHHRRQPSTPRQVKETLHARSEYTNSEDDGRAIHRINQYVIKEEIGRGSFGAVHLAVDQHGNQYAVKEFSKARLRKRAQSGILRRPHGPHQPIPGHLAAGVSFNSPLHRRSASDIHEDETKGNPLYLIREEIAIMKKLNHHNLVSLYEVLDDPTEDWLYMVLEMCEKGVVMKVGMHEPATPHDAESCRCWFRDLILGIEYLHAQDVVHRDIKPDNLLLTKDDVLKVVDFGVSEMFEKNSDMTTKKTAGSPAFLPPELCVSKHGGISGKAADIWSMGVTLYCLYFGRVPFEKLVVYELYEAIKNDEISLEGCEDEDFRDLMTRLLEKDPAQRIQMSDLREHPWVTRRGTDPLLSADENTTEMIEPPTEEEMNKAITGNLSNLLMKAVNKFKSLLSRKRPFIMDSILGQDTRVVQPPTAMDRPSPVALHHKAQSEDVYDRRSIEQALAREGVHRRINADLFEKHVTERDDSAVIAMRTDLDPLVPTSSQRPNQNDVKHSGQHGDHPENHSLKGLIQHELTRSPPPPTLHIDHHITDSFHDQQQQQQHQHSGNSSRSHTHSPSSEDHFLYLSVGPGPPYTGDLSPATASMPTLIVSESPAAETNGSIYERAYHDEVERIRRESQNATFYLTRRMDNDENHRHGEKGGGAGQGEVEAEGEGSGEEVKTGEFSQAAEKVLGLMGRDRWHKLGHYQHDQHQQQHQDQDKQSPTMKTATTGSEPGPGPAVVGTGTRTGAGVALVSKMLQKAKDGGGKFKNAATEAAAKVEEHQHQN